MQETKVSSGKNPQFFEFAALQGKGLPSSCPQKTRRCENLPKSPKPAERPRLWSRKDPCGLHSWLSRKALRFPRTM